jgi:hypothetical protein
VRDLTDQPNTYSCCLPTPSLALACVKHFLSLPSSLDHAVVPGVRPPSLQYQEPRNSDLCLAIPITTCIGMMPSIARLASPSFISCLVGLHQAHDSHKEGVGEVVEQGARLGVLLVFPSQLLTSYRLLFQKPLVSTKRPARDLPYPLVGALALLTIPLVSRSAGSQPAS